MINKTKFQYRILKKYGVLPVFDGEIDRINVKSPLAEGETFSNWCERVIGRNSNDVLVYQLEQPTGQRHIENMKNGGKELLALFRAHARNTLQQNAKNPSTKNDEDEFGIDEFSDFEDNLLETSNESQEPWYVVLNSIKNPECLKSYETNDHALINHEDFDEYSEEYGDAARHLIVLNDISQYVEELSYIFSAGGMDRASEAANDLVNYIEASSEIDVLIEELSDSAESDRERIEREHVKLYLGENLCHQLFGMIDDMFFEFEDELESLTEAENFIGNFLIPKSQLALKNCVHFLLEI
jgi:hypothetical protein